MTYFTVSNKDMFFDYDKLKNWIDLGCDEKQGLNVTILDIRTKHLTILPNEICNLKNLEVFLCSGNPLKILPENITQLVNLTCIDCCFDWSSIFVNCSNQFTNLTHLYCSWNSLTVLPDNLTELVNLKIFFCDNNELTMLPSNLGKLTKLEHFDCNHNSLIMLPDSIGLLTNLTYFDCWGNKLKSFPQSITNLKKLKYLNIQFNELELFAPNIARFIENIKTNRQIHNNVKSIHNHDVHQYITESVQNILSIKNELTPESLHDHILQNEFLEDFVKQSLFECCNNKYVHPVLLITFEELFCYLYTFIYNHNFKEEFYKIINLEMSDGICECPMKRLSMLIDILMKISMFVL